MSKYKLTFKLKQHTPIIHFQHDQHGATLRVTEVKPKLDRFILKKLGNDDYEKGKEIAKSKGWLVGKGEHPALDYKLRFEPIKDKSYYLFFSFLNDDRKKNLANYIKSNKLINKKDEIDVKIIAPSPYFANNDKVKFNGDSVARNRSKFEELRYGVLANENIKGVITSFNTHKCQVSLNNQTYKDITLLELIHKVLTEFFLINNFGTRQNKGFGSFTVVEINEKKVSYDKVTNMISNSTSFTYKIQGKVETINDIFKLIDNYYKKIKNKPSKKSTISLLRDYFDKKEIMWEKPAIKNKLVKGKNLKDKNKFKYVRALLGLAELFDYPKSGIKVKVKHAENNDDKKIERFQSPITFKPIGKEIYFLVPRKTHLEKIKGEKFWFYTTDRLEYASNDQKLLLSVPNDFDLIDFIKYALNNRM